MQILATGLMVLLFKLENYAIGAGLAKCEAPVSAVLGVLFFGTVLSVTGWIGVLIGTLGVLLMSSSSGWRSLSPKIFFLGMSCSTAFALTSLWVREASLSIGLPFPHSAACTVFSHLAPDNHHYQLLITARTSHFSSNVQEAQASNHDKPR